MHQNERLDYLSVKHSSDGMSCVLFFTSTLHDNLFFPFTLLELLTCSQRYITNKGDNQRCKIERERNIIFTSFPTVFGTLKVLSIVHSNQSLKYVLNEDLYVQWMEWSH